MHTFLRATDWEQHLLVEASRTLVLEPPGNPVWLITLRLYRYVSARSGQAKSRLWLDVLIQGTGQKEWTSATRGFFVSYGSAQQVAAAILTLKMAIPPLPVKLAEEYRGAFHAT